VRLPDGQGDFVAVSPDEVGPGTGERRRAEVRAEDLMPTFAPAQLASWTGGRWTAAPAAPLAGFTMDTRQLRAGQMFVAIKTAKRDGHEFLAAARAAGATAALVAVPNPALALPQLVVADP